MRAVARHGAAFLEEKEDFFIDKACQFLLYARQYFMPSRSSGWGRRRMNRDLPCSRM